MWHSCTLLAGIQFSEVWMSLGCSVDCGYISWRETQLNQILLKHILARLGIEILEHLCYNLTGDWDSLGANTPQGAF